MKNIFGKLFCTSAVSICFFALSTESYASCADLSGKYIHSATNAYVVIQQTACDQINIEEFSSSGWRNSKWDGTLDGKCNDVCSYPQPGCTPASSTRCWPICSMFGCRTFDFPGDTLLIEESEAGFPQVDRVWLSFRDSQKQILNWTSQEAGKTPLSLDYIRSP